MTLVASDRREELASLGGEVIVTLHELTKTYGPTLANDAVTLTIRPGDIIGLVGGNGAGKSTLMRMLCGETAPDSGVIHIDGREVSGQYGATEAQARGIRVVHQELSLCANLSVAENFYLEAPRGGFGLPGWRNPFRERARAALEKVFPNSGIDVDRQVGRLPIGARQMVEIARALTAPDARLVVLDEPTSSLGLERSQQLRAHLHARAAQGTAFVFISHKLHEIIDVATRIAVMRNGRLVWEGAPEAASVPRLVGLMGGEAAPAAERRSGPARAAPGEVLVRIAGPAAAELGGEIALRAGEIVGLAGLEGGGQREMLHQVFAPRDSRGTVERRGRASFVSGDRGREGVFPLWNVLANISIERIARLWSATPIGRGEEEAHARPAAEQLRLDPGRFRSGILDLSGGNQQKALVARALASDAPVILLDDPTRGVDVGAKQDFYATIADLAGQGRVVMWYSTEDLEFLECDRVLVFSNGTVTDDLRGDDISEQKIVDASFRRVGETRAVADRGRATGVNLAKTLVRIAPFVSLVLVLAVMGWANPLSLSSFGLDLLLSPAVPLVLIALGQMFVVGGSEIDLGAGAFAGLVNVVSATLLLVAPAFGVPILAALLLAYGLLGALIQARRIPAIVVTLGASFIWIGIGLTLQPTPGGSSPEWLTAIFAISVPFIPTSIVFIVAMGIIAVLIDRAPLGVALRGFGNNPQAMAVSGWSPVRYATYRYLISGLFMLAAGLALTAINTASDINSGNSFTLLSVAAVVIGGCSLLGGIISPIGVVAGAVTLGLLGALLGVLSVSSNFNPAVQGLLLLAILAFRALLGRKDEFE
jgi:ribose transport system ATP-binding protein